jgi:HEAT repeat protein
MHSVRLRLIALFSAIALTGSAGHAETQGKNKAPAKAPDKSGKGADQPKGEKQKKGGKVDLAKLQADLESGDGARVAAALETIAKAGDNAAAPLVEALLKKGVSAELTVAALDTAGALKQSSSSAAIAPYVKHRTGAVRHAAAKALVKTKGPNAVKALKEALRSSDAQVRGIAASGLGALNAKDSLPDLFNALAHNVGEAAGAIGQLCEPKDCEKLAELTGKHPFDVMSAGFDQILFRAEKDMPEDQKIKIVGRLRELGTKEASRYLADVKGRWPENWSKRVKQAIDAAVRATGGGGEED